MTVQSSRPGQGGSCLKCLYIHRGSFKATSLPKLVLQLQQHPALLEKFFGTVRLAKCFVVGKHLVVHSFFNEQWTLPLTPALGCVQVSFTTCQPCGIIGQKPQGQTKTWEAGHRLVHQEQGGGLRWCEAGDRGARWVQIDRNRNSHCFIFILSFLHLIYMLHVTFSFIESIRIYQKTFTISYHLSIIIYYLSSSHITYFIFHWSHQATSFNHSSLSLHHGSLLQKFLIFDWSFEPQLTLGNYPILL